MKFPLHSAALISALCMILVSLSISSCFYDNEEDLYPYVDDADTTCNLTNITYSNDIKSIIDQHCVECHGSNAGYGAASLHTYNTLRYYLDGNKDVFISSIDHTYESKPMPEDAPKLPDCEINKLKAWIGNGYPNN